MNKSQQKVVTYAKMINEVVEKTEETGTSLNPFYEQVKKAIDDDKLSEMKSSEYQKILDEFTAGVETYKELLAQVDAAIAPPRVMGVHRLFQKAYQIYYDGCVSMLESLHDNQTCDAKAFDAAGEIQDQASDDMSHHIDRISKLLF